MDQNPISPEHEKQARFALEKALVTQRNQAMDEVATLCGEITLRDLRIAELEKELAARPAKKTKAAHHPV